MIRKLVSFKKVLVSLSLLCCFAFTSCLAGPHQLARTVDDFDGKLYTESPWIDAALQVIPVIPFARYIASFADALTGDAYAFWAKDAWDNKGTGFKHKEFLGTDGHVESLLLDSAKWFEVKQ